MCQADIPVYAVTGVNGGYEILDDFKMNNQLASEDEFAYMATAINGLKTLINNPVDDDIYEKITAISNRSNTGIILDFSVLREGDEKLLQTLQSAVINKQSLKFSYTNNQGETRVHYVEPIAVIYKWYAWYMLAYNKEKQDYRTYKLVQMEEVFVTEERFINEHMPADKILTECDNAYKGKKISTKVRLRCCDNAIHRVKEYLNGKIIVSFDDGSAIMEIYIVENEQSYQGSGTYGILFVGRIRHRTRWHKV